MNCKVCGAEIPEGSLYCEKCGSDIHIVPDFKEFAERKAEDTVKNMMNEFDDDEADFGRSPEGANDERPEKVEESHEIIKPRFGWLRFALLAASVMILVLLSLWFFNRSTGSGYLLESAKSAVADGDSAKAIALLERVEAQSSEDVDALFYLAQLYLDAGDTIKYENLLLSVISMPFATSDQNAMAYEMLLAIYYNSEDYVSMADILLTCNNVEIKDKYVDFCMMIPEFNLDSGYYGTDQLLKITVPGNARIFYTLDGSEPDEESFEYVLPLLLTKGEYTINVRTLNSYGIWCPVTEVSYVIETEEEYQPIEQPQEPEIEDHSMFDMGNNLYLVDGVPCILDANGLFVEIGTNTDGVPYIYNVYGELVPLDLNGIPGLAEYYEAYLQGLTATDVSGNEDVSGNTDVSGDSEIPATDDADTEVITTSYTENAEVIITSYTDNTEVINTSYTDNADTGIDE